MNLKFISGLAQSAKIPMGGRELWEVWGAGPSSYNQTTGDPVYMPATGEHMTAPSGMVTSADGLYDVTFQPSVTNSLRPSWTARWFFANPAGTSGVAKVAQNAAGSGMTPGTYPINFSGGTYTVAATGTVTVNATSVTAVNITNPGVYTAPPTATIGGSPGGTLATLTVTMSIAGVEVPTGANLSAETVQFLASGGQM